MSLLSSLFKSKKVNLTPDVSYKTPEQASPQFYKPLSELAQQRIKAGTTGLETPGVGFGQDFVAKSTNPVADSMRRNFNNVTSPFLSSQYSARGLGNSSLAASAQGLAQGNVESDIGNLMAQFYTLNEQQKKNDITQGINLGSNLMQGDINQSNQIAGASERLANATAQDARAREQRDAGLAGGFLQAGAQLLNPIGSMIGGQAGRFLTNLGSQYSNGTMTPQQQAAQQYYNMFGTKVNIA